MSTPRRISTSPASWARSSISSRRAKLPAELARRIRSGEHQAIADALNLVDDRRPGRREAALALLDALERETPEPGAHRIGVTGPPGAGKSTLIDALVRRLRSRGETVGVIAVDPSSPRSGGALLGDRIRMRSGAGDPGVFVRSMAARRRLGGIGDATWPSLCVLAAAFDRVMVETVGVGQSETEVAALVDTLVYVAQPGAGDTLQFMKAGLLELPDVFVVNKADAGPPAERTAQELAAAVGLAARHEGSWKAPVLLCSARDGRGVDELLETLDAHRRALESSGELARRRAAQRERLVIAALEQRYGSYGLERLGGAEAVAARLRAQPGESSFALLARLAGEIEQAVGGRKPHDA